MIVLAAAKLSVYLYCYQIGNEKVVINVSYLTVHTVPEIASAKCQFKALLLLKVLK